MGMCGPWLNGDEVKARRTGDAEVQALDSAVLDRGALAASEILYGLTAQAFPGPCAITLRPATRPQGWTDRSWSRYYEGLTGWAWLPAWGACFGDPHTACCGERDRRRTIDLDVFAPVNSVDAIRISGVVLDSDFYRVDESRFLVRQDGLPWPMCQSMTAPAGGPGTFEVDMTYGDAIPNAAIEAAAALAGEFAKTFAGKGSRLPSRVQQVTRQGVSWSLIDPMTFFKYGRTGIVDVDYFIMSVNPNGQTSRPRVVSPDIPQSRRVGAVRTPNGG